ncbi:hypothetical protein [Wenyingzhuangia sp. IMCC45467]
MNSARKNNIQKEIILNNKINLSISEKLRFYRTSILFTGISFLSLTNGIDKLPFEKFNLYENPLDKIGVFTLVLSFISYLYFNSKLKIKKIEEDFHREKAIHKIISFVENNSEWKLIKRTENYIIIQTKENSEKVTSGRNFLFSPSFGDKIYIGLFENSFFIKSIFNLNNKSFLSINTGESKINELKIYELIKSTANTG